MAATRRTVSQQAFQTTNATPRAGATTAELQSGEPILFRLPPVSSPTLFRGDYSHFINVPQGAVRLEIRLASMDSDVDLYVRQGVDVTLDGGQVTADAKSEADGFLEEVVVISGASLKPGPYYIAVGVFSANVTATCVLSATYSTVLPTNAITGAHFVAGGGWFTSVFLTNNASTAQPFTMRFFNNDGSPMKVPLQQGLRDTLTGSVSPGGAQIIDTIDAPELVQGWVAVIPDTSQTNAIVGFAAFRSHQAGRSDFEAAVPLVSSYGHSSVILFDNANGFETGVALTNPCEFASVTLQVTVRAESGIAGASYMINLGPKGHTAIVASQGFPATAGKRGSLLIRSNGGRFDALGLRFSPAGPFTSFPPQIVE
jgi:hypothetical protein